MDNQPGKDEANKRVVESFNREDISKFDHVIIIGKKAKGFDLFSRGDLDQEFVSRLIKFFNDEVGY